MAEPYYDPVYSEETRAANIAHDRKYGFHISLPRVYTNIARNLEYQPACPDHLLEKAKDADEERRIIWEWHNRKRDEPILTILEKA